MIQKYLLTIAIAASMLMGAQGTKAQGTAINTTGAAANGSAILDVQSTNQGVLVPRIASTGSIATPVTGLMIYNTTTNQFNYYNGTAWTVIGDGAGTGAAGGNLGGNYPNPTIASLPAISGANLTGLNASNLGSGTVPVARLASSGTAGSNTFLNGAGAWASPVTLTTTGTTGAATYTAATNTLNIPNYATGGGGGGGFAWSGFIPAGAQAGPYYAAPASYATFAGTGAGGLYSTLTSVGSVIPQACTLDYVGIRGYCRDVYLSGAANVVTITIYKNFISAGTVTFTVPNSSVQFAAVPVVSTALSLSFAQNDVMTLQWVNGNFTNGAIADLEVTWHFH